MSRAKELFERFKREKEAAIDWFVEERETENLFLDFKTSNNDGNSAHLDNKDKANYAKAISGFGNSEGGVIIWGVDCRPDKDGTDAAGERCPIGNPRRFAANLNDLTKGRTIPPHNLVENEFFETGNDGSGYVISFIPKCDYSPLQTVNSRNFYVRIGSSFDKASFAYLASQFGKRPQPALTHTFVIFPAEPLRNHGALTIQYGINIENTGAVLLRDVYLNVIVYEYFGGPSSLAFRNYNIPGWTTMMRHERSLYTSANDGIKIQPISGMPLLVLAFTLQPPFESGAKLELTYGCKDSHVHRVVLESEAARTASVFDTRLKPLIENRNTDFRSTDVIGAVSSAFSEILVGGEDVVTLSDYDEYKKLHRD